MFLKKENFVEKFEKKIFSEKKLWKILRIEIQEWEKCSNFNYANFQLKLMINVEAINFKLLWNDFLVFLLLADPDGLYLDSRDSQQNYEIKKKSQDHSTGNYRYFKVTKN